MTDMDKHNKYRDLAKNTAWFTVSSAGSKLLSFFLVPLYTSVLQAAEYGVADMISTSASLLTYVFTLDIASAVLRFAMERREDQHGILSYGIRVLLVGTGALAIVLAGLYFARAIPWAPYCYLFLLLHFFALALYGMLGQYLRATDRIKEAAVSGLLLTAVTVTLNVALLLFFRMGVVGYLVAVSAGLLAASCYCLWVIRRSLDRLLKECCDRRTRREMRSYSIPLIFNGVAWGLNHSLDKYMVIWLCGAAENGLLSVAYKIPTLLTALHGVFAQAWNISAVKVFDKEDKDGFFSHTYAAYNAFLVIVCSALVLCNIPIAKMLFAGEFFAAWQYSPVLLVSSLFGALSGILGSVFTAVKASRVFAVSTVTAVIVNTVLNWMLIHRFGTMGAAVSTAAAFFIIWLIRLLCTGRYIRLRINICRDLIAYLLLCGQVALGLLPGHGYVGQVTVMIVLVFLYRSQILGILTLLHRILSGTQSEQKKTL